MRLATKSARASCDKRPINLWSTGRFVPPRVQVGFPLFVRGKRCPGLFTLEGQRGCWLPRRPKCWNLVLPSVLPNRCLPCAVLTRSGSCVSGFWTRQVALFLLLGDFGLRLFAWAPKDLSLFFVRTTAYLFPDMPCMNLLNPKPGHTTGGWVGAPGGAAGRRRARLGANRIIRPGNKSPPFPPRHRRNVASTYLQKHELWFVGGFCEGSLRIG